MGMRVLQSGVLSLLQDRGRFGYHRLGLTNGGPLDSEAFHYCNRLLGNAYLDWLPVENLTLRSSFGVDYNFFYFRNFRKAFTAGSLNFEDELNTNSNRYGNWVWSNTANYKVKTGGKHALDLLAGRPTHH